MKLITTRKQLLELLPELSLEPAIIPVSGQELQAFFKDAKRAVSYEHTCETQTVHQWLVTALRLCAAWQQSIPQCAYLRILSSSEIPEYRLERMRKIIQGVFGGMKYIYAYDLRADIPAGAYHLTLLAS